jgi:competence protein ComEA
MKQPTWDENFSPHSPAEQIAPDDTETARSSSPWKLLALLGALVAMFYLGSWASSRTSSPPPITVVPANVSTQNAVVVHVAGAVKKPGVYSLPSQARISQAIARAGGALPDADVNKLNLADWAKDGARIEVPEKPRILPTPTPIVIVQAPAIVEEFAPSGDASTQEIGSEPRPTISAPPEKRIAREKPNESKRKTKATKPKKPDTIAGMPRALTPDGKPSDNASPEFLKKNPLNLNRATAEQLEALPGVGPSLAQKILEFRKANGGFKSVEELDQVPGIGPKKLEEITPLVTLGASQQQANTNRESYKSTTSRSYRTSKVAKSRALRVLTRRGF